jgi:4-amino-4-deoxy-L-arabinose transferase-like glycosyltransferase
LVIWQARIVGLFFLAGAVTLIYLLARRLYDRSVADIAFAALFLTATIVPQLPPILMARQVMAEIPMLLFILGGSFCFYLGLSRSLWLMPLAVLPWASGGLTKAQATPFLAASLLLALTLRIWSRQWKVAGTVACSLVSTCLIVRIFHLIQQSLPMAPAAVLPDVYSVVAVVPVLKSRWLALQLSLFFLPIILGLI